MVKINLILLFVLLNVLLFANTNKKKSGLILIKEPDHKLLRDTVFTNKDAFIEVNLKQQKIIVNFRNGEKKEYLCSTGNPRLFKAVATNEGIYVIQYKSPKEYSRQFDSTVMLYWMGFNHGIGFHALTGSSYYRYLGKRPSSHGCIRVARNDIKEMYDTIKLGTPVIVHSENSARVIAFTDGRDEFITPDKKNIINDLNSNLEILYSGYYFHNNPTKIIITSSNVTHNGLPIGDISLIPEKQHKTIYTYFKIWNKLDKLKTNMGIIKNDSIFNQTR